MDALDSSYFIVYRIYAGGRGEELPPGNRIHMLASDPIIRVIWRVGSLAVFKQ